VRANPEDPRFRRIRCENERFHADVGQYDGATQILLSSGFQLQVSAEGTALVMTEPDLSLQMDAWTVWYDTLKGTIARLQEATSARDRAHHGGLMG
jgi:PUB domain